MSKFIKLNQYVLFIFLISGLFLSCKGDPAPIPEVPQVIGGFEADIVQGVAPLNVSFTDLTQNNPDNWMWDFGDGETSIDQNPTHIYDSTGSYTVKLIVNNSQTIDTITKEDYIIVEKHLTKIYEDLCPGGAILRLEDGYIIKSCDKLMKIDNDLNEVWIKEYEFGNSKLEIRDDGFIILGNSLNDEGNYQSFIAKLDGDGNLLEKTFLPGESRDSYIFNQNFYLITNDSLFNYSIDNTALVWKTKRDTIWNEQYLLRFVNSEDVLSIFAYHHPYISISKYDLLGNYISYSEIDDNFYETNITAFSNLSFNKFAIAYYAGTFDSGTRLKHIDSEGEILLDIAFPEFRNFPNFIIEGSNQNIWVCGTLRDEPTLESVTIPYINRYDELGSKIYSERFEGYDIAHSMALGPDNYYIAIINKSTDTALRLIKIPY